jgi:hypothetical protein
LPLPATPNVHPIVGQRRIGRLTDNFSAAGLPLGAGISTGSVESAASPSAYPFDEVGEADRATGSTS